MTRTHTIVNTTWIRDGFRAQIEETVSLRDPDANNPLKFFCYSRKREIRVSSQRELMNNLPDAQALLNQVVSLSEIR